MFQIYKLYRNPTYSIRPKTGAYTRLESKDDEKGWSADKMGCDCL